MSSSSQASPSTSAIALENALQEEGRDTILIEGLLLPAEIGVLDSEKGRRQSVRFDVEIETVPDYRKLVRDTGQYVSYADTVLFIQEKAASGGHVELVEEWAEAVAEFVLENPLADKVTVKVTKPDIFEDAAGVGIRIVRRRG
ncbi:dihydroneopterin aldolase [Roseibium sediminicola]|uniref:dihydroneopterin aldolase n=1 Tax=Roseibium sediminicola TaxID=2933272 RepID=A0ABT0H345_9HYPH|nr:dihydroneopterin aldolase [Roseibium sp. CAU 1639]MCK7615885.1 dihydroneopterin aldolase [Roseibium sp. CAU 1639]